MPDYKNIRDRSYRRGELSSRFPNISEEEKFHKEVIGKIAVWHTPEEVHEVYQQHHNEGKTIEAILSNIRTSEIRQREAINRQTEIIGGLSNLNIQNEENRRLFGQQYQELGRGIERVDIEENKALVEIEEFLSSPSSLVFYDKNGIKITEEDMKKIFKEYFHGTDLEDVSYKWGEILNPEYLGDIVEIFKMIKFGGEPHEVIQLMTGLATKLDTSTESIQITKRKKLNRAKKENEIRVWILSVGVNKLRRDIISDPKRVAINYKIDRGETAPILTELNNRINRQFRTRFTPIDWIPWIVVGIVGLVCFGLWFAYQRRRRIGR